MSDRTNSGSGSRSGNRRSELSEVTDRLSRSTQNLWKRATEIRDRPPSHESLDFASSPGSYSSVTGSGSASRRKSVPVLTREYPDHGKLTGASQPTVEYAEWEPAEILKIAIVVGPDELASGILRNQFTTLRGQRHEALVYRWQDSLTFDVIAFDLLGAGPGGATEQIDLMLLSDHILGPQAIRAAPGELERAALTARLKFPDTYLVGILQETKALALAPHPFRSVEEKARRRSMDVFDDRLVGLVSQDAITTLLVGFARSERYAPQRSVWALSPEDGIPLPVTKAELLDGPAPTLPP